MGCGAGKNARRDEDEEKVDAVDEESVEGFKPATLEEKKERRERIKKYRTQLLEKKMDEVSAEEMLSDDLIEMLIRLVDQFPMPAILFQADGSCLHLNPAARSYLNHDETSYSIGNIISKFIKFPAEKLGSPTSYKNLVVSGKTLEDPQLDTPVAVLPREGSPVPAMSSTMSVDIRPVQVFITTFQLKLPAINDKVATMMSRGSFTSSNSSEADGIKKVLRSPKTSYRKANTTSAVRDQSPRKIQPLSPRFDDAGNTSSDSTSDLGSSRGSVSSLPSSLLRKYDRVKEWNHGDVIITMTEEGAIKSMSHGAQKLLNVSIDDVMNKNVSHVTAEEHDKMLLSIISGGEIEFNDDDERRISFKTGVETTEFAKVVGITELSTSEGGWYIVRFEVFEGAKKKKLAFSFKGGVSEEMAAVFEAGRNCVVATALNGEIVYCNELCLDVLRYKEEELLGEPITMLVPQPHRSYHPENLRNVYTRVSHSFFGNPRATVVLSKYGRIIPISLEITELQTPQNKSLYISTFRPLSNKPLSEVHPLLPEMVKRCAEDERNTAEALASELKTRQEARRIRAESLRKNSMNRRLPRSPRGNRKPLRSESGTALPQIDRVVA
eukprot:TRINITY_DN5320_c0_g1_i2.p1 TRINITY_DN5320_c0_g1~~TRINITY_DN5320_c0_g1_i2.p1  ORF type:complete len:623 (+),score=141.06 TRINITY_DN5320_c0_g1_i2:45-1871(+)